MKRNHHSHAPSRRAFIQNEPIKTQLKHGLHELIEIHRLADIAIGPEAVTTEAVLLFHGRGQDDHGEELGTLIGAKPAKDLEAIQLGELQVQEDDLRSDPGVPAGETAGAIEIVERFDTVVGHDHFIPDVVLAKGAKRERFVVRIVLDQ
jgi:hypothetical protein